MTEELFSVMTSAEERRKLIHQKVLEGLKQSFPISSRSKSLELTDVKVDDKHFSPSEQKAAILRGDTLSETVKGTLAMRDADGKIVDKVSNFTIARIPWFTPRHTMIIGGNEYSVSNQLRPKPGVYAKKRANGILEAAFNMQGGTNFSVSMDPEKGEPQLEYGASKIPLYPILRKAGVSHEQIAASWGKELADKNSKSLMPKASKTVDKLYAKIVPAYAAKSDASSDEKIDEIFQRYARAKMDPEVNRATLGKPYAQVTPDSLLAASSKVLRIFKNPEEIDDRDNLDFKALHSVDDFFKEVITLNARDIARKTAIKMEGTPELRKALPSGPFTAGLLKFINTSQLVAVPTQTNPMELIDASMRITSLGEGGIGTERAIPMEARQTHVTQIGALDPFRTPESFRAGIDVRVAMAAKKDAHGNIYVPIRDVKTGRNKYIRAGELQTSVVAFPNQEMTGTIDALVNGQIRKIHASKAQYQLPHPSLTYSPSTNLVPFIESLQGNRAVMGSKYQTQALSLIDREVPWVQVKSPSSRSFESHMGDMINPTASVSGTISKIDKDYIYIKPNKGHAKVAAVDALVKVPYETHFPLASKTHLHHNITVKVGDKVTEGQSLGDSNFSKDGILALGKNLRVAYMPYYGANSNDAVVISESAAKKLTSERMYTTVIPVDNDMAFNKKKHNVYYGHNHDKVDYERLDEDGIIKPGQKIDPGTPIAIGLRKSQLTSDDLMLGRLHKSLAKPYREFEQPWDHDHPGEVIDVVKTPKRIAIMVKTQEPMTFGDKLVNRAGGKGVVSKIVPDDQMIQDESGQPIDVILTSAGVVSRTNPAQIIEAAVGKVAEKTGKPIIVDNLSGRNNVKWAKDLLKKHGLKDKETVFDPLTGKKMPGVMVGRAYIMKLMKSTDVNYSARGVGNYDVNQQPTKGGLQSAKALGKMEFDALVAHNARNILQEASTIKSQKNDEYWRAIQLGLPTPPPKTTFAYNKLLNMLTAAGTRVHREGNKVGLMPLLDEDVRKMSSGEIQDAKLIQAKNLQPERGGLFDPVVTGGLSGTKWSHINLAEPIVSPTFREPVRRFLGMTNAQLDQAMLEKGGKYIKEQLSQIDLDAKEKELRKTINKKKSQDLDNDIKQLKYIQALKAQNLTPDKAYVVSTVPILPPVFRPVVPGKGGQELIYGDINPLYRDLVYVNNQMKETKTSKLLPDEYKNLRPTLNQAVGAVYGVNDPVTMKSQARGHKGFLTYIGGVNSPKYGYFHSKIMKRNQDMVGRGTAIPDNTLGMDEIGLPENMLWTMYDKHLIKHLVQHGYSAIDADKMVKEKHPAARDILLREMANRPVLVNRAPTLHRYSIIAAYPKPVAGKTIRVNPFIEPGLNLDYDGDCAYDTVIIKVSCPLTLKDFPVLLETFGNKESKVAPGYYTVHLRDFPYYPQIGKMKDNKEIYRVPEGVQVFGYSQEQQRVVLCDVTAFSIHRDLKMVEIQTRHGEMTRISADDSMFGLSPETGELTRFNPMKHTGWAIPRPRNLKVPEGKKLKRLTFDYTLLPRRDKRTISVTNSPELTTDLGWLLGAMVGDGWISYSKGDRHSVCLANINSEIIVKFTQCIQQLVINGGIPLHVKTVAQPHEFKGFTCSSKRTQIRSVTLTGLIEDLLGGTKKAIDKELPPYFVNAPEDFLRGLLAGLIDTDGTVSIVKAQAKKYPQLQVAISTISPKLAHDIQILCRLLNVTATVHREQRDTGTVEYRVNISSPELAKIALDIPCVHPKKKANLEKLSIWDFSHSEHRSMWDVIPISAEIAAHLAKLNGCGSTKLRHKMSAKAIEQDKQKNSVYVTLRKATKIGYIGRTTFNYLREKFSDDKLREVGGTAWFNNVSNPNIWWDFIDAVIPLAGKHTAWDLTVPDGNTFMTANQLIVYDTLMIHAPSGNKAVEEAKGLTMSKLLYGDQSKGHLLAYPQHESIMGIASATVQDDKNKPIVFKNEGDAQKAYNEGKIGLGTRVKIGNK